MTDEDSIEHRPPTKRKKGPRILDGQYFEIETSDDKSGKISAVCKLCGVIKKGSSSGTGNFLRHIKKHHADKSDEVYNYINSSSTNEPLQIKIGIQIPQEKVNTAMLNHMRSSNIP